MLRALLIGLAVFVIAVVLITAVAHLLTYGFLFLVAIGVGFLAFRVGRRSRNRR
jgi:uncharacterized membrane protein YccC